jgi:hypothetical protein
MIEQSLGDIGNQVGIATMHRQGRHQQHFSMAMF